MFAQRSLSVTICGRLLPCCSARVATLPKNVQLGSKQNICFHCFLMSVPPDIQPPKINEWKMATLIRDHFERKGWLLFGGCKWLIMGGYLKKYFYKCSSFFQPMFGVPKCNPYKPKSKNIKEGKRNWREQQQSHSPNLWHFKRSTKMTEIVAIEILWSCENWLPKDSLTTDLLYDNPPTTKSSLRPFLLVLFRQISPTEKKHAAEKKTWTKMNTSCTSQGLDRC